MRKPLYGIAINDANYVTDTRVNGVRVTCKVYLTWLNMLNRCYGKAYQEKRPTYIGCIVCEEWLTFSNFKSWMEKQNWHGKQLDKDFLQKDSRIYSPETCVFIDADLNRFTTDSAASRGAHPIGVSFNRRVGKMQAECSNPFTKEKDSIGYFDCPNEAHEAWRKRKHELACQLADMQEDPRVAAALRTRYLAAS